MMPVGPTPLPEHLYAARSGNRASMWRFFVRAAVGIAVGLMFAIFLSVLFYRTPFGETIASTFGRVLPLPAARVGSHVILYRDYVRARDGWVRYSEVESMGKEVDYAQVSAHVIDRLIEHAMVQQIGEEVGVTISDQEIETAFQRMAQSEGGEALFLDAIARRFGWSREDFIAFVLEPILYVQNVDEAILASNDMQAETRARLERMRGEGESGVLPDDVDSDDAMWSLEQYPEEARGTLLETAVGSWSEIVELKERLVVYRVLARTTEGEETMLRTRELSSDKIGLDDVLRNRADDFRRVMYVTAR